MNKNINQINEYLYSGRVIEAKLLGENLLEIMYNRKQTNTILFANILDILGNIYKRLGQYNDAKVSIETAIKLYKRHYKEEEYVLIRNEISLASLYCSMGNYIQANLLFNQLINNKCLDTKSFDILKSEMLVHYSIYLLKQNNFDKALKFIDNAIELCEYSIGKNQQKVSTFSRNILSLAHFIKSKILFGLKDYKKSEMLARKSINIAKVNPIIDYSIICSCLIIIIKSLKKRKLEYKIFEGINSDLQTAKIFLGNNNYNIKFVEESLSNAIT